MTAWAGSTRRRRLPADWPTTTRRILERDQHRCQIHGPRCTIAATTVDHIVAGDDHRDANLRAACVACHGSKSGREGATARHRYREQREPERHPGLL